jgi:TPR repeat protein
MAAKKGHHPSLHAVGVCAESGTGCNKRLKLAHQMYTKAATAGNRDSMYRLALAELRAELGQMKDINKAIKWLKRGTAGMSF